MSDESKGLRGLLVSVLPGEGGTCVVGVRLERAQVDALLAAGAWGGAVEVRLAEPRTAADLEPKD